MILLVLGQPPTLIILYSLTRLSAAPRLLELCVSGLNSEVTLYTASLFPLPNPCCSVSSVKGDWLFSCQKINNSTHNLNHSSIIQNINQSCCYLFNILWRDWHHSKRHWCNLLPSRAVQILPIHSVIELLDTEGWVIFSGRHHFHTSKKSRHSHTNFSDLQRVREGTLEVWGRACRSTLLASVSVFFFHALKYSYRI